VVTLSLQSFSFLLTLPVLTMGVGMWLMAIMNTSGRHECRECSNKKRFTSPSESQGTLTETRRSQAR